MQYKYHVDAKDFPTKIRSALEYILTDLSLLNSGGYAALKWVVEEPVEVGPGGDIKYDTAYNTLNTYFLSKKHPSIQLGSVLYIDY